MDIVLFTTKGIDSTPLIPLSADQCQSTAEMRRWLPGSSENDSRRSVRGQDNPDQKFETG